MKLCGIDASFLSAFEEVRHSGKSGNPVHIRFFVH